ncbi:Retrovirus-related Pol polyprotein from transposon opus [Eumeta japonica]|uniref:Retrovirus-related Pol polyprotein from transposon opus n=1 Tax=Eumeta variegata TaxID=151549 RepID=A0A4C1UKU3_EUMVA|nr:Retrovirus-related Pol polyprotein from transposon opus [Eumeta japonica]
MSYGHQNAAQTFQRFVDELIRGFDFFCFPYIENVLIASKNKKEHQDRLRALFTLLQEYGVIINASECNFGQDELTFLGYIVSANGVRLFDDQIKVIQSFPPPKTKKRFLGMLNIYQQFQKNAAKLQAPLHDLLAGSEIKGSSLVNWTLDLLQAFEDCEQGLFNATMLIHSIPNAELTLVIHASIVAVGAILQQHHNGEWQSLAFYSKKVSPIQQKYSPYDRELLTIYESVKRFRHMREGRHFIIYTDRKSLTFTLKQDQKGSPRQINQLYFISQFTAAIKHISVQENRVTDALSRIEAVCTSVDMNELVASQRNNPELRNFLKGQQRCFYDACIGLRSCTCRVIGHYQARVQTAPCRVISGRPSFTRQTRTISFNYFCIFERQTSCEPSESKNSSPPSDTRNPRKFASALSTFWVGIKYLIETGVGYQNSHSLNETQQLKLFLHVSTPQNHQFGSLLPTCDRLKQEIEKKRPEFINRKSEVFHHDNARSYSSLATQQMLREFGWGVLHLPYSPHLASSDFHLHMFWSL